MGRVLDVAGSAVGGVRHAAEAGVVVGDPGAAVRVHERARGDVQAVRGLPGVGGERRLGRDREARQRASQ
jgi:hypothetical protein